MPPKLRRVLRGSMIVCLVLLSACGMLPQPAESAKFYNPCDHEVHVRTYGDASGGPKGESLNGGNIAAKDWKTLQDPFTLRTDGTDAGGPSVFRHVLVLPSGVEFDVQDDGTPTSDGVQYVVSLPPTVCGVTK